MNNRIYMVCLFALIGSLKAFSDTSYEQTYVEKHQGIEGVPVPTKVVRPELVNADDNLQIEVVLTVDSFGKVTGAEVVKSTNTAHNEKVVEAAKRWEFRPALIGGEAVASKVKVPFVSWYEGQTLAMR